VLSSVNLIFYGRVIYIPLLLSLIHFYDSFHFNLRDKNNTKELRAKYVTIIFHKFVFYRIRMFKTIQYCCLIYTYNTYVCT
jgi:hypothetical protein